MLSEKENIKLSKFLSLILRHHPETIGIQLDKNGWTDVDILIRKANASGIHLDINVLKHIVDTNTKKRFSFDESLNKIRANQGHSVAVELGYKPQEPQSILYHGTSSASAASILETGLHKRNRHHVHLSSDTETAIKVGQRHGSPVVFEVSAQQMFKNNFQFYLSDNGVWLTDFVPPQYVRLMNEKQS